VKRLKNKGESSNDIENGVLTSNELKSLSDFINSVCKHKTERNNLHVHNHHLKIEFVDFNAIERENQIRIDSQNWENVNENTSILIPSLNYFLNLVIQINNKILSYINNDNNYKEKMVELYCDEWKE
jgi:hypothetical protein